MNRLPLLMASSVIAVSAFTMFSLAKWFKNSQVEKESSKISSHFTANDTSLSKVTEFDKENLSLGFATCLCSLIKVSDYNTRQNLIMCLHEASSFCQNFGVIRDSKCLEALLSLLDSKSSMLPVCRQNLSILQVTTNLACDQQSLPIIKNYLGDIFLIADTTEYSDQACAAFQVLANIALTSPGCDVMRDECGRLCSMLGMRNPYLLRNLLAVLVNLSCDANCCDKLLVQNPEEFAKAVEYSLSLDVPPLISLKMTALLNNLYSQIVKEKEKYWSSVDSAVCPKTIAVSLKENRTRIESWILSLLSSSENSIEFNAHLQKLLSFVKS